MKNLDLETLLTEYNKRRDKKVNQLARIIQNKLNADDHCNAMIVAEEAVYEAEGNNNVTDNTIFVTIPAKYTKDEKDIQLKI